jgi:GTP cyclohydrolase I
MIVDSGDYYSQCEHHMVPFFGKYYFAYIPGKKILGLSKVARIVDFYSAKLQVQERLGKEIIDELEKELKPKGIALVLKGRHLCKEMRGARKTGGEMVTSELRGVFKTKPEVRQEFLSLINK